MSVGSYLSEPFYPQCYASFRRPTVENFIAWTNHASFRNPRLGLRDVNVSFRVVNTGQIRDILNGTEFTSKTAALSNMTNWLNRDDDWYPVWIDATYDVQHRREALGVHPGEAVPSVVQRSFPQQLVCGKPHWFRHI